MSRSGHCRNNNMMSGSASHCAPDIILPTTRSSLHSQLIDALRPTVFRADISKACRLCSRIGACIASSDPATEVQCLKSIFALGQSSHSAVQPACPLYPQKQTHAVQQFGSLLDQLVGK